jgi:alpha-ketoglutarate-dependent taurine dioxygenase
MSLRIPQQQAKELLALASQESDPATKQVLIDAARDLFKMDADNQKLALRIERNMVDLRMARIQPWDSDLDPDDITQNINDADDLLAKEMLTDLEQRGISHIRITAQSPEGYVVKALAKFIGPLTKSQNDFNKDVIQLIEPKATGVANSGNTLSDLGLHVDGTQHSETPAVLIFYYVAGAKIGANSVFVDSAKVLLDIDEERRHEILLNLARPDAATFSKKNMVHTGPIFYFSSTGSLVCRIRFDEVLQAHPKCKDDYEFLRERFNDPQYAMEFRPREGDIIVFDNWRVLHARDEVFGMHVRCHWRGWVSDLKRILQPKYYIGIRPFPTVLAAQIEATNTAKAAAKKSRKSTKSATKKSGKRRK